MEHIAGSLTRRWTRLLSQKSFTSHVSKVYSSFVSNNHDIIQVSEEVKQALAERKPVVSLESTIITHGMPYPHNLQTAVEVEGIVRRNGCVPATIGVIDGQVHVGLEEKNLERLASDTKNMVKISRRDFPYVISKKLNGGTTVSGTMVVSHSVGIPVFVTGGIGGVHRGADQSMDISADLTELGRTPVTVVSAGVKSILDIEKTLEYLETQGVCVATFGENKDFPAFFSPSSGLKAPYNVNDETEAAQMIYASHHRMKLSSGILIGVPIPERFAANADKIESIIQTAVEETREKKIRGKQVTPYILQRVHQMSGGESLSTNVELIKNNAEVGSRIAKQLNGLVTNGNGGVRTTFKPAVHKDATDNTRRPVVIGGTVLDFNARLKDPDLHEDGSTNPGSIEQSFGGVGRNMADCLSRLGAKPFFISAVGDDLHADNFYSHCQHMDLRGVKRLQGQSTATYCAVLGLHGQLKFGVGDMDIHQQITPQMIMEYEENIREAEIVILDGNISPVAIETACTISAQYNIPVMYEPTDIFKASKPFDTTAYKMLTYTTPNLNELQMISSRLCNQSINSSDLRRVDDMSTNDVIDFCLPHCLRLVDIIPVVIVTLGKHGVLVASRQGRDSLEVNFYPAPDVPSEELVSVSGAGDCFNSAFINGLIAKMKMDECVKAGLLAARMSLLSKEAVPSYITPQSFFPSIIRATPGYQPKLIQSDLFSKPRPLKPMSVKM